MNLDFAIAVASVVVSASTVDDAVDDVEGVVVDAIEDAITVPAAGGRVKGTLQAAQRKLCTG